MIARPNIGRNERTTTEIGACEVRKFALFSRPALRRELLLGPALGLPLARRDLVDVGRVHDDDLRLALAHVAVVDEPLDDVVAALVAGHGHDRALDALAGDEVVVHEAGPSHVGAEAAQALEGLQVAVDGREHGQRHAVAVEPLDVDRAPRQQPLEGRRLAPGGADVGRRVALVVLAVDLRAELAEQRLGRKRVIQVRFNVSVPRARVPEKASTLRDRSER